MLILTPEARKRRDVLTNLLAKLEPLLETPEFDQQERELVRDLFAREMDTARRLVFEQRLMYPPSANEMYVRKRNPRTKRYDLAESVKTFRNDTAAKIWERTGIVNLFEHVAMDVSVSHPKLNRTRDIDNPIKPLADALVLAKVMKDDSQIDQLSVRRVPQDSEAGWCSVRLYLLHNP